MKIAVVGGGSTYTPELVSGLTRLDVDEFVLQDVDPGRREIVGGMAARMLARQGFAGGLEAKQRLLELERKSSSLISKSRDGERHFQAVLKGTSR